jgi:hypothetical protein
MVEEPFKSHGMWAAGCEKCGAWIGQAADRAAAVAKWEMRYDPGPAPAAPGEVPERVDAAPVTPEVPPG